MIPEIGHFALILALLVSVVQGILSLVGAQQERRQWVALARPSAYATFLLLTLAFAALTWAFYSNDFSVAYVAQHSNSLLPLMYRLGAVWGAHEGSLLLWVFLLTMWTFAVAVFSKHLDEYMVARVIGVLGLVTMGLLLFILFTSNPFERIFPVPENGRDLNPLLQDPGLVLHPPILYMGYVGFSVAFAFAIASLLYGKLDAAWARWTRPWTILAWMFLTLGIALGSRWAYYVLGWGGWWFWDPVENASFMPWLIGTALIHSLAVTEKRGTFKSWTVLLAILAFSLSLLGTFLVRSGVLTSVHAFATDPRRGIFILLFLVIVVGASLVLFAVRAPKQSSRSSGQFHWLSRETLILLGNVFLVVAASSVLLGTLYPLIMDSLSLGKISVGPPYFNSVFVPIMVPALVLMGIAPWTNWKDSSLAQTIRRLWLAAGWGVVSAIVIPYVMGPWSLAASVGFFCVFWIAGSSTLQAIKMLRAGAVTRSFWAMQLGHLGIAAFVFGVVMVTSYQQENDVRMSSGDTVQIANHELKFLSIEKVPGPNYEAMRGHFELRQLGQTLARQEPQLLQPEKRTYFSSSMPMTDSAVDVGLTRDIYISLGEPLDQGAWAVRVHYKPFVNWIWGGCFLMALGGLIAISDKRYRRKKVAAIKEAMTFKEGSV